MIRRLTSLIALGLLAACGSNPAPTAANGDARSAEGDVLEGSISDEMLPLETIQSVSPPMKVAPKSGDDASGTQGNEAASDGASDAAEPAAAAEAEEEQPAE